MAKFYYLKRRRVSQAGEEGFEESPLVLPAERLLETRAATESSALTLVLWLSRALLLVILVAGSILGGVILIRGGELVENELTTRAKAAERGFDDGLKALKASRWDDALANFRLARSHLSQSFSLLADLGQGNLIAAGLPYYQAGISAKGRLLLAGLGIASGAVVALEGEEVLREAGSFNPLDEAADSGKLEAAFGKARAKLALASQYLGEGEKLLGTLGGSPEREVKSYLEQFQSKLALASGAVVLGEKLLAGAGDVLGFTKPREYLLIFQNTNEIRPTGGFIGSYGLLELNKGRVTKLVVDDIYNRDRQLSEEGSLPLPLPFQRLEALSGDVWPDFLGMRDANFNPDFPASSKIIRRLYEQAGGGSVDGVVALNAEVLSELLRLTGTIYLPEHNLKLTADNIVSELQQEIEVKKRGTAQPKEILGELLPILLARLRNISADQRALLSQSLLNQLHRKEILVALDNAGVADVLGDLHFDGALRTVASDSDYLMVNRANLGGRKSSQNLFSRISYLASLTQDGAVNVSLDLAFSHRGSSVFPDGDNIDYVRVLVPPGSTLLSITGQDLTSLGLVADREFVETGDLENRTVFAFWVTTRPGETKEVVLNYRLPFTLKFQRGRGGFKLHLDKQPGTKNALFLAKLQLPRDWISYADDPFSREGGLLTLFNGGLKEDVSREIVLER